MSGTVSLRSRLGEVLWTVVYRTGLLRLGAWLVVTIACSMCAAGLAMLLVALIFVTYGYDFAKFGAQQTSELAGLPLLTIYIAWPLAGLTWLAFLGEKLIEDFRLLYRGERP